MSPQADPTTNGGCGPPSDFLPRLGSRPDQVVLLRPGGRPGDRQLHLGGAAPGEQVHAEPDRGLDGHRCQWGHERVHDGGRAGGCNVRCASPTGQLGLGRHAARGHRPRRDVRRPAARLRSLERDRQQDGPGHLRHAARAERAVPPQQLAAPGRLAVATGSAPTAGGGSTTGRTSRASTTPTRPRTRAGPPDASGIRCATSAG